MTPPKPTMGRPTTRTAKVMEEGEVQLKVRLPAALHRAVKVRVAERGISVQDFVIELLAKEGLK